MTSPLNFRSLDLNLLRVFDEVMAERSLTKAAHKLSITQPAVSNAMRRLREVVGDELMVRSGQGWSPPGRWHCGPACAMRWRCCRSPWRPATLNPPRPHPPFCAGHGRRDGRHAGAAAGANH